MRFAFDIDETIVKGDIIPQACDIVLAEGHKLDKLYTEADCADFGLSNFPQVLREKIFDMFSDPKYAVWEKVLIEGVYYFLYTLHKMGHEIYLVTSRPASTHEASRKFFNQKLPFINGLFFSNQQLISVDGVSKSKILELLGPDVYFDDAPVYVEEAVSMGIETYMVQNKRTSWNHSHKTKAQKIKNPAYFPVDRLLYD